MLVIFVMFIVFVQRRICTHRHVSSANRLVEAKFNPKLVIVQFLTFHVE